MIPAVAMEVAIFAELLLSDISLISNLTEPLGTPLCDMYFTGELLSVNPGIARWVRGLFNYNERVCVTGGVAARILLPHRRGRHQRGLHLSLLW